MSVSTKKPLDGLKVVAIEQAVAAPFASARLADAGAQVFKIERPEGDFARGYDDVAAGMSSYFVWLNRGKESVVANLATPEGKELLTEMLATADVLLQNLKPGALARLGFDFDRLEQEFQSLIVCSISGFGNDGPMANRKAYDLLIQAESGLCSITGSPEEAARVGISIVDIATGASAYSAILEALISRSLTGKGCHISVSMFDVIAEWLTVPLLNHEVNKSPKRIGLAHPSIAPYGVFTTSDGQQVLISVQSDREWKNLCTEFVGRSELGNDTNFSTNVARVENRATTDKIVSDAFSKMTQTQAVEAIQRAGIAFASVNDMAGLSEHPHLRRITVETPNGPVSHPSPAPIISGEERSYGPVPDLVAKEL